MARSRPRVRLTRLIYAEAYAFTFAAAFLVVGCNQPTSSEKPETSQPNANVQLQVSQPSSLESVIARAEAALQRFRSEVRDYKATLTKRERIGKTLGEPQSMSIKIRSRKYAPAIEDRSTSDSKPKLIDGLHAYLRFVKPASVAGREVIWIEGENNNQLTVHEAGMLNLISMNLDPSGSLAMVGSKYPITDIGIEKLLEKLIERGTRDKLLEPAEVTVTSESMFGDVACDRIRIVHPKKQDGFDFHIAEVWIDPRNEIPIYYASYDWPKTPGEAPTLMEEYGYRDLELNVGLGDVDFDTKNSEYQFP